MTPLCKKEMTHFFYTLKLKTNADLIENYQPGPLHCMCHLFDIIVDLVHIKALGGVVSMASEKFISASVINKEF